MNRIITVNYKHFVKKKQRILKYRIKNKKHDNGYLKTNPSFQQNKTEFVLSENKICQFPSLLTDRKNSLQKGTKKEILANMVLNIGHSIRCVLLQTFVL